MKSYYKAGILAVLLILPVFVFLFLKGFGENHYSLRIYYPQGVDSSFINREWVYDTVYHKIPDFKLLKVDSSFLTNKDLKGKIYVADFFFSRCLGICPKMSNQLGRVQEEFKDNNDVKIVSYTVDPQFDNTKVLQEYSNRFKAIPEKWYFLTGPKDSIYTLAQKGYFLSAGQDIGGPEAFLHSDKLVLVDKDSRIRGYYNGTDQEDVDRLITEIKVLLHEYHK